MKLYKPINDNKEYIFGKLDNGIEVLNIYDNNSRITKLVLTVSAGFNNDPVEFPGVAHFLEHMLFMGTLQNSNPDFFLSNLNLYGGTSNAITSDEFTSYFFEVHSKHFNMLVEIFSHFFISPLFDANMIVKEINAVNSEHEKNRTSDLWRLNMLLRSLATTGHVYNRFGGGNNTTLSENMRYELIKFFDKYYVAANIKIIVSSNIKTKKVFERINECFKNIPYGMENRIDLANHVWTLPFNYEKELRLDDFNKVVKVVPIEDVQTLNLFWQFPNMSRYFLYKPLDYIAVMIENEAPNSLYTQLKQLNLVVNIDVIKYDENQDVTFLYMFVHLTDYGYSNIPFVISSIFSYIRLIQARGIDQIKYHEISLMKKINFDYDFNLDSDESLVDLSYNLFKYPKKYILNADYVNHAFHDDTYAIISNCLDLMRPFNTIVFICSKNYINETTYIEKWYGTQYEETKLLKQSSHDI